VMMLDWIRSLSRQTGTARQSITWVSVSVLEHTAQVLRQSGNGATKHEGIVYWAGRHLGSETVVTTCIAPAARSTWGSFSTSSGTNARVVMYLAEHGLELLGQVHSHPGAVVDHSDGDDERALMPYEGFVSIVVPRYGRNGLRPLTNCGVHVYENSRFRRLPESAVMSRFHVVDEFADLRP